MVKILADKIKKAKNIAIFCHTNPDADAIGSAYALSEMLKSLKKNTTIILEKKLTNNLSFINFKNLKLSIDKTK